MNNKNRESFKNIVKFLESLCLLVCFTGIFAWCWYEKLNGLMLRPYENKGNMLILAVYLVILILFLSVLGGFKIGVYRKASVALSQAIAIVCTNAIICVVLMLMISEIAYFGRIFQYMGMATVAQIIVSVFLIIIETAIFRKLYPPKNMLVMYEKKAPKHIIAKIQTREDKYHITKTLLVDENWKEQFEHMNEDIEAVMIYDIRAEIRNDILKYCFEKDIRTYSIPKISDILIRNASELNLFDTPILVSKNAEISIEQRFLKRCMDIVISLAGIILSSPIILITAIAIKIYDGGPVFFRQSRCTIDNKVYQIIKFRSMITDAEKDGVARLATENDDRITPIGHFIRKTRIDEIPQFFNVLKGDMSIVGPRPERPEIIAEYCEQFPEFMYRTKVKAGLTGYAQVFGKYNTTSYDKLKWDLMYIEKFSIWLDLKLIIMTIKIVFMKESTEGLEEGKATANSNENEDE